VILACGLAAVAYLVMRRLRVDEERDKHERRIMRDVPRHQVVQAFDHRLGVGIGRIAVDMAY